MIRLSMFLAAVLAPLLIASGLAAGQDDDLEGGTVGTGILGVITGFGSIHVNGVRVQTPSGLRVHSVLGQRAVSDLRRGETVIVEAARNGDQLVAKRLRAYHPLIGPVEAAGPGALRVMGVDLDVSEITLPLVRPGDWVAVSGLWRGRTVVVSAIQTVPVRARAVVNGAFTAGPEGQWIGGVPLQQRIVTHAKAGDHLTAEGLWTPRDNMLRAERIDSGLFPAHLRNLLIEGWMRPPNARGAYWIDGSGLVVYTDDPDMQTPAERSLFCVSRTGPMEIRQETDLDGSIVARQRLLERMAREAPLSRCLRGQG